MAKVYEKCEPKTVAFIGLGTMGYPMAGHLARAGHRVTVYNATGMMVADYELPAGGYFVIPASDFNAGMYIVKVAGENTVKTIKIVK